MLSASWISLTEASLLAVNSVMQTYHANKTKYVILSHPLQLPLRDIFHMYAKSMREWVCRRRNIGHRPIPPHRRSNTTFGFLHVDAHSVHFEATSLVFSTHGLSIAIFIKLTCIGM